MAFINEYIPPTDKKRYNITQENHFYLAGINSWTVDRERDIFLLFRAGGAPETERGVSNWAFYWGGHLLDVRLRILDAGCDITGFHGWEHSKVVGIGGMSPSLHTQFAEVVGALREALIAFKGLGLQSRYASYAVTLDT